ncbi:MAG: alpha-E domain-containing protein [Planctomycetaceae bacterium]
MLSRVAESIYWMARNVERAENIARFVDINIKLNLDHAYDGLDQWEPLVQTTGDDEYFAKHYGKPGRAEVIKFLAFDPQYGNSLISCLRWARENARTVREAIPSEVWEQLNDFYHLVRKSNVSSESIEGLSEFFQQVKQQSHLYNGILDSTMSRGDGWHFANMGRMFERADKTSRLLDVKYFTLLNQVTDVNTTMDDLQWSALLRSVSGFEMYRKKYHTITIHRVAEFLVQDLVFPRSICFCLDQGALSLNSIIANGAPRDNTPALDRLNLLRDEIKALDIKQVVNQGFHEFIDDFQRQLNEVGKSIFETYFDRTQLDLIPSPQGTSGQKQSQSQR